MINKETINRRHFMLSLVGSFALTQELLAHTNQTNKLPSRQWLAVQAFIDKYVSDKRIAGAAVALSYGDKDLSYLKAGKVAFDSSTNFDENSLCRIYSMTKPVTGVAAMMLIEAGKIRLDQPVADIIPEFRTLTVAVDAKKSFESRPLVNTMTMRHLLTHTSGLVYWTPLSGDDILPSAYRERGITPGNYGSRLDRPGYGPQAKNLEEMVKRVAELPLAFEPGARWQYSIGLDVMGLIIERVSGKGLEVFLRERIFEPLGMTSTGFQVMTKDAARLTTNYMITPEGLKPTDAGATSVWLKSATLPAGGAGLVSTARDFSRFGAMVLGNGSLGKVRLLKRETARLAISNLLPPGVVFPLGGGFGAGARVVLAGNENKRFGSPGSFGWGGAAGTIWQIDPARRGNMVFMSQHMPPETSLREDVAAAIEADLKSIKI